MFPQHDTCTRDIPVGFVTDRKRKIERKRRIGARLKRVYIERRSAAAKKNEVAINMKIAVSADKQTRSIPLHRAISMQNSHSTRSAKLYDKE